MKTREKDKSERMSDLAEWEKLRKQLQCLTIQRKVSCSWVARAIGIIKSRTTFVNQIGGGAQSIMSAGRYSRALRALGVDILDFIRAASGGDESLPRSVKACIASREFQTLATSKQKVAIIALAQCGYFDRAASEEVKEFWIELAGQMRSSDFGS